ncbi:hypothetical protein [Phocaeicola dorei]|uniref:hypothetical protein n=1 Tax=Phocaeicola dorei TaxID=357276 RepID=UPI003219231C
MLDFLFLPCRWAFTRPQGLVFTCKGQGGKPGTNARRKQPLRLAASRRPYLRTGKTTTVEQPMRFIARRRYASMVEQV